MTSTDSEAPIIDTHAHVYTLDMPQISEAWHRPSADASIDDYIAALDENNVTFGVLAAASLYGDYNDYQLEAVRRCKRLRTTVIVDPRTDVDKLRRMNDVGVVGIRLQFRNVANVPDLKSYEYQVLLRRIADLGWHVQLHDDAARLPNYIAAIESAGPRLVIDHMARPEAASGGESEGFLAVLRAVERGKTWVKISGGFRIEPDGYAATIASKLLRHVGPQRLMWGSRLAVCCLRRSDELLEGHRRLPGLCSRCVDPPFDRSNGSRFLFFLNKAWTPEHGYHRKTADRSRDRGADGRFLARRRPELGRERAQLFHGGLQLYDQHDDP
jgi:predicted TIM-barrel fold metal-dependent hydrolase